MPTFSQFAQEHLIIPGRGPAPQTSLADVPAKPYTYQGSGGTTPPPPAAVSGRRPPRSRGVPLNDPEWLAGPPVSAPREWHDWLAMEAMS